MKIPMMNMTQCPLRREMTPRVTSRTTYRIPKPIPTPVLTAAGGIPDSFQSRQRQPYSLPRVQGEGRELDSMLGFRYCGLPAGCRRVPLRGLEGGSRRRTLATCACLALALSATIAGTASASLVSSGGFNYVTKSFDLPPGKSKTFKASCPKRHHVLGGGHYNNGLYGDVISAHSYPYDSGDRGRKPDDGWAAL